MDHAKYAELNPDVAIRLKGIARVMEMGLGFWLFASAFVWNNPGAQQTSMWTLGLVVLLVGALACIWPWLRFVNTAAALWLFASVFALPRPPPGGIASNLLTALALFGVSLVPTASGPVVKQRPW